MARNRFVVTYDIVDDDRRAKVYKRMRDFGDRIQYSVFRCELDRSELIGMKASLHKLLHHTEDQILMVDLGPVEGRSGERLETMGRPLEPEVRTRIV